MTSHSLTIQLLSNASDCINDIADDISAGRGVGLHRRVHPSNAQSMQPALQPFRLVTHKRRIGVVRGEEFNAAYRDYEESWSLLLDSIEPHVKPTGLHLLDEARSAVATALLKFKTILLDKVERDPTDFERAVEALKNLSEYWGTMIATSNHPELTQTQLQKFSIKLPSGQTGILNEYTRTKVIDLDHPENNLTTGHIRLRGVDNTFVISLGAKEVWNVLFTLFTGEATADGSVYIERRIHPETGKPIPVLDCFKAQMNNPHGPWALRQYINNVSAVNSAGGRTGRKTSSLYRIDPDQGSQLNSDTRDRRNKIQVRQKPKKLPSTKRLDKG